MLASLEEADSAKTRLVGLLGRDGIDGVLLLRRTKTVHTIGMRFAIDVAWCDDDMVVLRIETLEPNRVARPLWAARAMVEAEAGSFERWGLAVGDQLDVTR